MTQLYKRPPASPKAAAQRHAPIDAIVRPGLFRALADATRLRLLACLAKCSRACSVGEIAECCSVDLSVVSRHLSLLADEGVLHVERSGRAVFYALRSAELAAFFRELASAIEQCAPPGDHCGTDACCMPAARSKQDRMRASRRESKEK